MAKEPFAAYLTCLWTGGFFFWMIKGFKGPFSAMLTEEKRKRNFRVGYLLLTLGLILIFMLCLPGCTNVQKETAKQPLPDSIPVHAGPFEPQPLSEIMTGFEKMAKDTVRIDSTVYRGPDTIRLLIRNYALRDTFIVVPEKYTAMYGLKSYKAPEFSSDLQLVKNGVTLLDTSYTKNLFFNQLELELELVDYGALMYPTVAFEKSRAKVDYSISIPLTDVGVGVSLFINFDGKLKVIGD